MSRANSRWTTKVKRIQMILCRCLHSSSEGTPFARIAFDWCPCPLDNLSKYQQHPPRCPSIIKIAQINAHFKLELSRYFKYIISVSWCCSIVRLIYAKRFNIRFEISLSPHLISNINQALFYTHFTARWGNIHLGNLLISILFANIWQL